MEKMQESINKDLEELKNKHTETNNTIIEIKNTPEGINSKISEAEEWISELEDKMVEIILKYKIRQKEWQELRIVSETSRTISNAPTLWENFWRDYSWKFHPHGKGNSQSSPRDTKSPIQDKPKEKHAKTHTNETNKD